MLGPGSGSLALTAEISASENRTRVGKLTGWEGHQLGPSNPANEGFQARFQRHCQPYAASGFSGFLTTLEPGKATGWGPGGLGAWAHRLGLEKDPASVTARQRHGGEGEPAAHSPPPPGLPRPGEPHCLIVQPGEYRQAEEVSNVERKQHCTFRPAKCLQTASVQTKRTNGRAGESTSPKFTRVKVLFSHVLLKSFAQVRLKYQQEANSACTTGHHGSEFLRAGACCQGPGIPGQQRLRDRKGHHSQDLDMEQGPCWAPSQSLTDN